MIFHNTEEKNNKIGNFAIFHINEWSIINSKKELRHSTIAQFITVSVSPFSEAEKREITGFRNM